MELSFVFIKKIKIFFTNIALLLSAPLQYKRRKYHDQNHDHH